MFRYGSLILSTEDNIIDFKDEEFGYLYIPKKTKKTPYLFANLASAELYSRIHPEQYSLISLGKTTFPAMLCAHPHDANAIGIYTTLSEQHPMLARKMPQHPGILEVVQFEPNDDRRDDMPETGNAIKITAKGYILEQDVQKQDHTEIFKPMIGAIFPNRDLIKDVRQHRFGDCFLLASILAVLNTPGGQDYIKSMMIQDGDHTIVRLFDPNTLKPIFIRVQNAIYSRNNSSDIKHEALWVHILEKAYTAIGFTREKIKDEAKIAFPAFREVFGDGGFPVTALTIFTGQSADFIKIKTENIIYPWAKENLDACKGIYFSTLSLQNYFDENDIAKIDAYLSQHQKTLTIQDETAQNVLTLLGKKFDADDETNATSTLQSYIEKYIQIWIDAKHPITNALNTLSQLASIGQYLVENDYQDDLAALNESIDHSADAKTLLNKFSKNNPAFPGDVIALFNAYIDKYRPWNAPLGEAGYTDSANAIFSDITDKLKNKYLLVASSKSTLPDAYAVGLRPKHGYAITGTCEKTIGGKELKFITIRNPWGHTGKDYQWQNHGKNMPLASENKSLAEFDVELSDFVKCYSQYDVGKMQVGPKLTAAQHVFCNDANREKSIYKPEKNFLERHWKKILIGAAVLTAVTLIIGLTLGFAAPAAFALGGVGTLIGLKAVLAVKASIVVGSAAAGASIGAGVGAILDKKTDNSTAIALRTLKRNEPAQKAFSIVENPEKDTTSTTSLPVETIDNETNDDVVYSSPSFKK